MKVTPIGRKVLIKDRKPQEVFAGTNIINPNTKPDFIADVVAVGEGVLSVKAGDVVKYAEYAEGVEMRHNGESHQLIGVDTILAIVEM